MSLSEFDLIARLREGVVSAVHDSAIIEGIGDDAAVVRVREGHDLVVAVDTLVEGRHFFAGTDPASIAHKALAVNLSDLAAMGAVPRWATLSLTLPNADAGWLDGFIAGWLPLAQQHGVALIGGDTTAGPLSVSVQLMGEVMVGKQVTRHGANVGDSIWVTGTLGDAALALHLLNADKAVPTALAEALHRPRPPVGFGRQLPTLASAAIDVSDGLAADLGHICHASGVGASIYMESLPRSADFNRQVPDDWARLALGGDDYQLCFCTGLDDTAVLQLAESTDVSVTRIGDVVDGSGVQCILSDGSIASIEDTGFDHFNGKQS